MKKDSNEDDELIYNFMFPERHKIWVPNMITHEEEFLFFCSKSWSFTGRTGIA